MREVQTCLTGLFHLTRLFRDADLSPPELVGRVFEHLFSTSSKERAKWKVGEISAWKTEELLQALGLGEDLVAQYVLRFHDSRVIPVTFYKREKAVRRYLDCQLSLVIRELIFRSKGAIQKVLISEEPIYYLIQKYRDQKFPKPKSHFAALEVLKARLHSDLAQAFGNDLDVGNSRRVLLPYEIR